MSQALIHTQNAKRLLNTIHTMHFAKSTLRKSAQSASKIMSLFIIGILLFNNAYSQKTTNDRQKIADYKQQTTDNRQLTTNNAQQTTNSPTTNNKPIFTAPTKNAFLTGDAFIENIGQYGKTYKGQENMDSILFGFEGHSMPILFTKKGIIFLQRKVEKLSHREEEKLEKQGLSEEQIEHKKIVTDRAITMEWVGASPQPQIIMGEKKQAYHTYGQLTSKAYSYKTITYKNLYNGIDLVYHFTPNSKIGFEYSFTIAAGADISQIKMQYAGDVKKIKIDKQGSLIIKSDIDGIQQSLPITYQTTDDGLQTTDDGLQTTDKGQEQMYSRQSPIPNSPIPSTNSSITLPTPNSPIPTTNSSITQPTPNSQFLIPNTQSTNQPIATYKITNNQVQFSITNYNNTQPITIDPFISSTSNLDGVNAGKAKDIDYDYAGNVYVTGGGDASTNHRLAKYNAAGVLQWTFNGMLTTPVWEFGTIMGGWVVEKTSGRIYLGQGFVPSGFRVIRLNSNGGYDNFITIANTIFLENWKMIWNCNNGNPQILIGGGLFNSNNNFGVLNPPNIFINPLNITNLLSPAQDFVDNLVDPLNNELYSIASIYNLPITNPLTKIDRIFKNSNPYSPLSILWNVPTSFSTLDEGKNRPYLSTNSFGATDNSANILALNQQYLFYWDGKNLKAFNKATGAGVGIPLITSNTAKMCGGIVADFNNNVYMGNINGTISSYNFNGTNFIANVTNDPVYPIDIDVLGYSTKSVYDLAFNEADSKIYACGDGFVASYPTEVFAGTTIYTLSVTPNCLTTSASSSLSPTPPVGTTISYSLYQGTTPIATNATGVFTSLLPLTTYKIIATLNATCSGIQISKEFTTQAPTITTTPTNEICGNAQGQIIAVGSGTTAPYTYSINGTNFFTSGTFTGLAAGPFTITVKDGNGCINTKQVTITNQSFTPTFTTTYQGTTCGNSTGTITATTPNGGVAPYTYSLTGGAPYQASNIFSGLGAGTYQLKVIDVNGCISTTEAVVVAPSFGVAVTALPTSSTCGNANGKITASNVGGATPFEYSKDGGTTYQSSNIFTSLAAGPYTIKIKDANGCVNTTGTITVQNTAGATVTGTPTNSTCGNANGKIIALANAGTAPYEYSINAGTTYQSSSTFTGLAAATNYVISIKDGNGCTNNSPQITVLNTPGATVTGTPTNSTCGNANGTITASPVGGTAPFQYSKDGGITYQTNTQFTGLAAATNYTITIKDANGCTNNSPQTTVLNTPGATVAGTPTNSTCGNANGTITASPVGGTAPFQYSKDGGITYQTSNTFTGLAAATYTITIKDANGCTNNSPQITVANTAGATVTGTPANSTCGNANGKITATASGGTAPFEYSLTGGAPYQTSNIFTGLAAANYTVTIKDANGCTNNSPQITVANTPGATVTGTPTNSTCGNANGKIIALANAGTAPYEYSINGGVTYQSSNTFAGLAAGTNYVITIKDGNGCLNNSSQVTVTNTPGATVSGISTNSTCGNANGKITASPTGGTAPFEYSLTGGAPYQTSNVLTGLLASNYTITIRDANGCINNSVPITVANTAGAIVSASSSNSTCGNPNGKIKITGTAGTLDYQYSLDNNAYQGNPNFNNLAPTSYTAYIKDGNNCLTSTNVTVAATPIPALRVFAGRDTSVVIKQPLQLNAIDLDNIGFTSYTWSPNFGLNDANRKDPTAILDKDFAYEVKATTADGCIATDSIKIKITYTSEIYVPTAFAPNGNIKNRVLRPILVGIKTLKYFAVYNRYGELIFKTSTEYQGWDGNINGAAQNTGTYVWIAEGEDYLGRSIVRKGTSTLVR